MTKTRRTSRAMRMAAVCMPAAIMATSADAAQPVSWRGSISAKVSQILIGGFEGAQTAAQACDQAGKDYAKLHPGSEPWVLKSASGNLADWLNVSCTYTNGILGFVSLIGKAYCPEGEALVAGSSLCVKIVDRLHPPNMCSGAGNPIYPLQGNKRQDELLGSWLAGPALRVVYDSRPKLPSPNGKPAFVGQVAPSFGPLWQSSLHKNLQILKDHDGKLLAVQAARGAGLWSSFYSPDGTSLKADANVNDRLSFSAGTWQYIDAAARAVESYDTDGKLLTVAYADGTRLTYTYSTAATPTTIAPVPGLIIQVQDHNGRAVNFSYEASGSTLPPRIKTLTNPAGQLVSMDYDTQGNLVQILWPDSTARKFLYENNNWALTGIVSENGTRLSTYAYEGSGRVMSTEWDGGAYRHSVSYASPPAWAITETYDATAQVYVRDHVMSNPTGLVLTLPNNDTSQIDSVMVLGAAQPVRMTQSAGAGCLASSRALTYDASGNIASADDFNQHRRCSAFDASNRETTRVEGLANTADCSSVTGAGVTLPAGSRKTSTQYHPDWRLASKVAEPGRITTYVYNGQPDPFNGNLIASCAGGAMLPNGKPLAVLCKRVEQATTDIDGRLGFSAPLQAGVLKRQSSWTYDTAGRVLTAVDPLNHSTVYGYYSDTTADHTTGDLRSVTNAKSQVTNYLRYDRQGRLLQSTDPNGVDTVYTYDERGRVKTASVGGQTLAYDYWPAGQLQRVTAPDWSYVDYTYDRAQRLVLVADQQGNHIQYTYDNVGNRTSEKTSDPTGQLTRQLTRAIDPLGRVQQTAGM